jgi:hypothetical protein
MKYIKYFFISMVLITCAMQGNGFCFKVSARVDRTSVSLQDSVFLTIEISGGKAEPDISVIKDFKVIPRGSSSSYNYINGRSRRKYSLNYLLFPLSPGDLEIPSIKVTRDRETAFTQPVVIHVTRQAVPDGSGTGKQVFARADVSQADLFTGQPAVYTLKFFSSAKLSGLEFEKPPEFRGFIVKQFKKQKNYSMTINGIIYGVTQVNYMIIPESAGRFTIDPAVLIANIVVSNRQHSPGFDSFFNDSFFNDPFFSSGMSKPVRVVSNPVTVKVCALPAYNGKIKYSGLVGRFDIKAEIDKTSIRAGESATLSIKISGSGNIMDAGLPANGPDTDDFKVYDDTPEEDIRMTETGYEGYRLFRRAIVPVKPGHYRIGPFTLVYFDVDRAKFAQVSTDPIYLDVTPSGEIRQVFVPPMSGSPGKNIVKKTIPVVHRDILDIKQGPELVENSRQMGFSVFLALAAGPGLLFLALKLFILAGRGQMPVEKIMAAQAKSYLRQAGKKGFEDPEFLGCLYSAIAAFVLSKAGKKGKTITTQEACTILTEAGFKPEDVAKVVQMLETIDAVRFGGRKIDRNMAAGLLKTAKQAMKLACIVIACGAVLAGTWLKPAWAGIPAARIESGINHYRAGSFRQAANDFKAAADSGIKNAALFYNIGNAFLKAGDLGHAILWYERAKRLDPGDPDIRYNLKYADSLVKDKRGESLNIIEILFFWESMIPLLWIKYAAVFFSFMFFSWAGIQTVRKHRVFSGPGMALMGAFIFFLSLACAQYYKDMACVNAVIVEEQAPVRSGTAETATKLFVLHAGTKVVVTARQNGYLKIVFSKDRTGWVAPGDAQII